MLSAASAGKRFPISRLTALCILAGLVFPRPAQASGDGQKDPTCPGCNVVLVAIDTLRPDHLGCYGYGNGTSPHMDRVAKAGVVFDRFLAQTILTAASMASIFTSQYPSNSYRSFTARMESALPTLPGVLRAHGYRTAAFVTCPEFYELSARSGADRVRLHKFFRQGFDAYLIPRRGPRDVPDERVFEWLKANKDSKFFLWLALGSVHWPYGKTAPPEIRRRFQTRSYRGPLDPDSLDIWWPMGRLYHDVYYPVARETPGGCTRPKGRIPLTQEDRGVLLAHYDAGIYYTDDFVGRVWDRLRKLGLERKTIFIILSEHAEDLGEHGYYTHYDIYNTELRAPLIVAGPGLPQGPRRVGAPVSGLDVAPTVLEMVGIPVFHQARGRSFLGELSSEARARGSGRTVFSERMPPMEVTLYGNLLNMAPSDRHRLVEGEYVELLSQEIGEAFDPAIVDTCVQTLRWKLIHRRSRHFLERVSWWSRLTGRPVRLPEYELYDLLDDPGESKNLYAGESGPDSDLKRLLDDFEKSLARPAGAPGPLRIRADQIIPYP